MKKSYLVKHLITVLGVMGMVAALTPPTPADSAGGVAAADIREIVEVGCFQDLNFGVLNPPDKAAAIWYIDVKHEDGTLSVMGVGTDSTDKEAGDHHPGLCKITGEPGEEVRFSVEVTTDFSADGYNLLNLKTNPNSPVVLETGELIVMVGGRLQIERGSPGLNGGGDPAIYTLIVDY